MSPRSPPEETAGRVKFAIVDLHQSEGRLLKSSRHKLFFPVRADFQMAESKVLFDMACDCVLERFKLET